MSSNVSDQALHTTDAEVPLILDEATDEVMRIHLDQFEGPMEVLLYLIRSQELDIFDIPISRITDQYLHFLELMTEQNLDVAGEYLVMAATLIQIKSKMLLPVELDNDDEEIDDEDPRLELVEKLIAYRKYREVTARLELLAEERTNWFTRNVKPEIPSGPDNSEDEYIEVTLYDLIKAFKNVLRYVVDEVPHTVEGEAASVDEKIEFIQNQLAMRDSIAWTDLFAGCKSRVELVCCFLAILELCRMGLLAVHQHVSFGDIRLFRRAEQQVA